MPRAKKASPPQKLRVAVIGAGHLGQHHARNYAAIEGVELVAVCDSNPEQGQKVASANGTRWVPSLEELPDGIHAVSIAAPTPLHHLLGMRFLEMGVHCLVEKPMTATLAEARELAELATQKGLVLQVGHIERFNSALDGFEPGSFSPLWIEARRYTPFTGRSTDTSVVFDLMVHDIDLVCWMVGSSPIRVDARGGVLRGPLEDWASARLSFEGGAVAEISASRVMAEPIRRIRVFGGEEVVEIDFAARKRTLVRGRELERSEHQGSQEEPLKRELEGFVGCIREGRTPTVSQREGLAAIEVAHSVLAQIRA